MNKPKVLTPLKARNLQKRIAYFLLTGQKPPEARTAPWILTPKVWHLPGTEQPPTIHCQTCRCTGTNRNGSLYSLCGGAEWSRWSYNRSNLGKHEFKNLRPCKRCLATLSKIANS